MEKANLSEECLNELASAIDLDEVLIYINTVVETLTTQSDNYGRYDSKAWVRTLRNCTKDLNFWLTIYEKVEKRVIDEDEEMQSDKQKF